MGASTVRGLIKELREDEEAGRHFVEEAVSRVASDPALRLALLQSLLQEAAAKHDLEAVKTDLTKRSMTWTIR